MINFEFHNPVKIIFGKDTESQIAAEIKAFGGTKVLLHYGSGSVKKNGVYDKVVASLKEGGINYVELGGVVANPRLSKVYEGIELCKKEGVDFILAVGGGSTIDSSKAIGLGLQYDGDVWDLYQRKATPTAMTPIGTVLTIAAAGSEMSLSTVITDERTDSKLSVNHPVCFAKFSILNPENTYSLPAYQTSCGVFDIMMHMWERYFTLVPDVDLTDRLIEGAVRSVMHNGLKLVDNPNDYAARAEVMWGGSIAHNTLLQTGRIGDWATHALGMAISAKYDTAHGATLSIIFPAWLKYVYKEHLNKVVQFAVRIMGVDISCDSFEEIALEGIRRLERMSHDLGLPTTLTEAGLADADIEWMAEHATKFGPTGNYKKLDKNDCVEIFKLAK